jgi:hypothetical protein
MPADTPRLSVEISERSSQRFTNLVPWGLRSKVMAVLLDDLLDRLEENGDIVLAAILNRTVNVTHIMKGLPKT